jgi:hypothetical protein
MSKSNSKELQEFFDDMQKWSENDTSKKPNETDNQFESKIYKLAISNNGKPSLPPAYLLAPI